MTMAPLATYSCRACAAITTNHERCTRCTVPTTDETKQAILGEIDEHLSGMEVDALRVVSFIAQRLRMGQRQYGPLDIANDTRDWAYEATCESADRLVYVAIDCIREDEKRMNAKRNGGAK